MLNSRAIGLSHIYLDEEIDGFSNLSVGILVRALGHNLKVAYVDVSNTATKFTNFLENLSLSNQFVKSFDRLYIENYSFKSEDKISKTILPLVEFNTINRKIFRNSLGNYDLVIFDNVTFDKLKEEEIKSILENKNQLTEVVFTLSDKKEYNKIKKHFDIRTTYEYKNNNSLLTNKNIITIGGNGRGKSIYSFGYVIRNFIYKKNIKQIFFDKGDDIYGEFVFFSALKQWSKMNRLYGQFDFVQSVAKRYLGPVFRSEIIDLDRKEAQEAFMLLKTALRKQTPVIADELIDILRDGVLNEDEVIKTLQNIDNELMITGNGFLKTILDISGVVVNVENENESQNLGMRIGIDF